MRTLLAALVVIACAAEVAHGQPSLAPATDPVWQAYDAAFVTLARGDRDAATAQLRAVIADAPGHPAAARARSQLAILAREDIPPSGEVTASSAEGHTLQARGELLLGMTVTGALVTADLCQLIGCESDRVLAAILGGTSAGSLAAAAFASRDGITQGQAQLMNSATTWTGLNAIGINQGFADTDTEAWLSMGATAGGLGLGLGLWKAWHPDEGQVALTNTGGIWTSLVVLMLHGAADAEPTWAAITIAGDLGLLAGAAVSERYPMSRGRTLLIDTGGVLGALFGGLIAVGADDDQFGFGAMSVSTTTGLVLAALLTRDWDTDDDVDVPAVSLRPAPMGERGWGVQVGWTR